MGIRRDLDRDLEFEERRLLLEWSVSRRRPRGVLFAAVSGVMVGVVLSCERTDWKGTFGVGGEGRAIVWPEEEETGDDRKSLVGEDTFSIEKHAGRLARFRLRLDFAAPGDFDFEPQSFSRLRSPSSLSAASPEEEARSERTSSSSGRMRELIGALRG